MKLRVFETKELASEYVAQYLAERLNVQPDIVLGLPTGDTPLLIYKALSKMYQSQLISFERVRTFNMDEYVGISSDDERSYAYFMRNNLFNNVDIKENNIHLLNGLSVDLDFECSQYEESIRENKGIDLFIGGVGVDGHIAFNERYSPLNSVTRCVKLANSTLMANAKFFDGDKSKVPTHALTVGIKTIMSADEVIILAFGESKQEAIYQAIEGAITHKYAITALQAHRNVMLICDELAVGKLSLETIACLKDV